MEKVKLEEKEEALNLNRNTLLTFFVFTTIIFGYISLFYFFEGASKGDVEDNLRSMVASQGYSLDFLNVVKDRGMFAISIVVEGDELNSFVSPDGEILFTAGQFITDRGSGASASGVSERVSTQPSSSCSF